MLCGVFSSRVCQAWMCLGRHRPLGWGSRCRPVQPAHAHVCHVPKCRGTLVMQCPVHAHAHFGHPTHNMHGDTVGNRPDAVLAARPGCSRRAGCRVWCGAGVCRALWCELFCGKVYLVCVSRMGLWRQAKRSTTLTQPCKNATPELPWHVKQRHTPSHMCF